MFSKLVQKPNHAQMMKRNVDKDNKEKEPKDKMQKLRRMLQLMNKRSVDEDGSGQGKPLSE